MKGGGNAVKRTRFWVILIGILLAASLAASVLLAGRTQGGTARVYQNGALLRTIDLNGVDEPYAFTVEDDRGGTNVVEVERGRIRVSQADCPDQVCVRQGWISTSAAPVVCLPHGLVIEIAGADGGPDAVTQ